MKLSHLFLILFAALALGFSGCSSDDSSSTTAGALEGTWISDAGCQDEGGTDGLMNPSYYTSDLVITATTITNNWKAFMTSTCTAASQKFVTDMSGAYTDNTTSFDLTMDTIVKTYVMAEYVTYANSQSECSKTWVLDAAQDVSVCYSDWFGPGGTSTYEISADGTTLTIDAGTADEMILTKQ